MEDVDLCDKSSSDDDEDYFYQDQDLDLTDSDKEDEDESKVTYGLAREVRALGGHKPAEV